MRRRRTSSPTEHDTELTARRSTPRLPSSARSCSSNRGDVQSRSAAPSKYQCTTRRSRRRDARLPSVDFGRARCLASWPPPPWSSGSTSVTSNSSCRTAHLRVPRATSNGWAARDGGPACDECCLPAARRMTSSRFSPYSPAYGAARVEPLPLRRGARLMLGQQALALALDPARTGFERHALASAICYSPVFRGLQDDALATLDHLVENEWLLDVAGLASGWSAGESGVRWWRSQLRHARCVVRHSGIDGRHR